ncbi:MAG: hypothetical protein JXB32_22715 [Deltaproteobacteria bacterium]|nr:hypothetical protein [Deltaproteobacteria bacterium]
MPWCRTFGREPDRLDRLHGWLLAVAAACAAAWVGCAPADDTVTPPRDVPLDRAGDVVDVPPDTPPTDTTPTDTPVDPGHEVRPLDTDNDGLPDEDELARGTDPTREDTDGDGLSDAVEVLARTDPLDPGSVIPPTDFYVVLPFEDEPQWRDLEFTARLGRGDIFFLVDTTGSMAMAINNVKTSLASFIVPSVQAAIADVVMGVGDFRDFPVEPYGSPGDWPFQLRQAMTVDIGAVQAALNGLRVGGGNDEPESQLEGLYESAAGACAGGGGFGQACFRDASHPIVVVVTDATAHNGVNAEGAYDPAMVTARSWTETRTALNDHAVKIVGAAVKPMAIVPAPGAPDLEREARDTGSFNRDGDPTVYPAPSGEVSGAVVSGIVDLVAAETQDVTARKLDDTSDAVDATQFIKEMRPIWASDPSATYDDTTFYHVSGGTMIVFSIMFHNDFQPHTPHVQIYRAYIEVYDLVGSTTLDTRNVYIVVPAEDGFLI